MTMSTLAVRGVAVLDAMVSFCFAVRNVKMVKDSNKRNNGGFITGIWC